MTRVAKHRHPEVGYPRGEETRARIVAAALKLFGERGFDGASTREIATTAGVNAPALQYYFDSKEGLYLACVDHIVSRVWEYMSSVVDAAEQVIATDSDDETLIEAYCGIQAQLAEFIFTSEDASDWRLFLARQQAGTGPVAGFELLSSRMNKRISHVSAAIIGRLLGRAASDDETLIRNMALKGQLMVFQVMRRSALTSLNLDTVNTERLALIKKIILEQTAVLLRSMAAARDATRATERARSRRARPARIS
jgi:TetR/AcrR family transcriptional regulator, regulator of cefoperazone and chloramphenicol sensitivity